MSPKRICGASSSSFHSKPFPSLRAQGQVSRVQRHGRMARQSDIEEQAAIHDILGDALARLGYQTLRAQTESRRRPARTT